MVKIMCQLARLNVMRTRLSIIYGRLSARKVEGSELIGIWHNYLTEQGEGSRYGCPRQLHFEGSRDLLNRNERNQEASDFTVSE